MLKKVLLSFFVLSSILLTSHVLDVQASEKLLNPLDSIEVSGDGRCIPTTLQHYRTTSDTQLRSGPGDFYASQGTVARGDSVLRLRDSGSWTMVRVHNGTHKGKDGWILTSHLTYIGTINVCW